MDITAIPEGSVVILTGDSELGMTWLNENLDVEGWQRVGAASIAVDWRFAQNILVGAANDGLSVALVAA